MNKSFILSLSLLAVSAVSCTENGSLNVLPETGYSGFGYAGNFFKESSEAVFTVWSDKEQTVTMTVRCKCRFSYDAGSCILVSGTELYPVVIPECGKWCEVDLKVGLRSGLNDICVTGVKPMKGDVMIDYIEF